MVPLIEQLNEALARAARPAAGQLVPQDPNDEPAQRLLERIRKGQSA